MKKGDERLVHLAEDEVQGPVQVDVLYFPLAGSLFSFLLWVRPRRFNHPTITHGYVLRGKELRAMRSADVLYHREGFVTKAFSYRITDIVGENYTLDFEVPFAIGQEPRRQRPHCDEVLS
jgi:hypothetical protein